MKTGGLFIVQNMRWEYGLHLIITLSTNRFLPHAYNMIFFIFQWITGNIKSINLAGNSLETLDGFSRLYSLEYLDVSNNQISQVRSSIHKNLVVGRGRI